MVLAATLIELPLQLQAQTAAGTWKRPFSAELWCADTATACWSDPSRRWYLNGVRLLADLDVSNLFQPGQNRFEGGLKSYAKVGLEFNLLHGWIAAQTGLMVPGSITFDDRSPAVQNLRQELRADRQVRFDRGWQLGLSFLDGSLSAGYGRILYDRRDFVRDTPLPSSTYRDTFYYVSLQPISSVRAVIKRNRGE